MTTHKIIENFLPEDYFKEIQQSVVWNIDFPWYLQNRVVTVEPGFYTPGYKESHWYASHLAYSRFCPKGSFYNHLVRFINLLPDCHALIRIKCNFYAQTPEIINHGQHIDYDFENKGAILFLNTCDGYTRLHDGTKVENIENRLLLFDPQKPHNSSTTTNAKGRFNINVNYL